MRILAIVLIGKIQYEDSIDGGGDHKSMTTDYGSYYLLSEFLKTKEDKD